MQKIGWKAAAAAAIIGLSTGMPSVACTRILWNDNGFGMRVGRKMDWPEATHRPDGLSARHGATAARRGPRPGITPLPWR